MHVLRRYTTIISEIQQDEILMCICEQEQKRHVPCHANMGLGIGLSPHWMQQVCRSGITGA